MPFSVRRRASSPAGFHAGLACVLVLLIFSLSGCAAGEADKASVDVSGPWADSMKAMSADGNDFVKSVLSDGDISDMEYQEALKIIEKCYASNNASVTYDRYGFETVRSLDGKSDPLELMSKCAYSDGGIVVLYDQMRRNPDNRSEEELISSCLVRKDVVGKGFTAEDFMEAMQSGQVPWSEDDERVALCNKDPLGTLSDK